MPAVAQDRRLTAGSSVYAGRRLALLTRHGKERVVAPVLADALGCRVEHVSDFDTDALGSFTREVARAGSQIETARRKARIGMTLAGLPHGLASEGAFGPDPVAGVVPWNVELVLFIDDERRLEVVGTAQGRAVHEQRRVANWVEAEACARAAQFPSHHLVLRPQDAVDARIRKAIATWDDLERAFAWAQAQAADGRVFIESDLRAHANPTRMALIGRAAADLAARLATACPACGAPGFGPIEAVGGLPCAECGAPTREPRADLHGCVRCPLREERPRDTPALADPARCDRCNP